MIKFRFPFPPSLNTSWRISPRGGNYLSNKAKEFYLKTGNIIRAAKPPRYLLNDRLFLRITLVRGDRRAYDVDNFAKSCADALVRADVMQSDDQIDLLLVVRGVVEPHNGHALIEIARMQDVVLTVAYIEETHDE